MDVHKIIKEQEKFGIKFDQQLLQQQKLEFIYWRLMPNNKLKIHGFPMKRGRLNGRKKKY